MAELLIDPSYAELVGLSGHHVSLIAADGSAADLWLESVSTPVTFLGHTSYSVRLTGPATAATATGEHVLQSAAGDILLDLEPAGRDVRHVHYEAYRVVTCVVVA